MQATDPVDRWFVISHGDKIEDSTEKGDQYWVCRAQDSYQDTSVPIRGQKASRIKSDHRLSGSKEKFYRQLAWELTDDLSCRREELTCVRISKKQIQSVIFFINFLSWLVLHSDEFLVDDVTGTHRICTLGRHSVAECGDIEIETCQGVTLFMSIRGDDTVEDALP